MLLDILSLFPGTGTVIAVVDRAPDHGQEIVIVIATGIAIVSIVADLDPDPEIAIAIVAADPAQDHAIAIAAGTDRGRDPAAASPTPPWKTEIKTPPPSLYLRSMTNLLKELSSTSYLFFFLSNH